MWLIGSQGKPEHTALESVYRQTATIAEVLAREGAGKAAFADVEKEILDKSRERSPEL